MKIAFIYLMISIFCAAFGAVYEAFSHEVYSFFMIYAWILPLAGGTLPYLLISMGHKARRPCPAASFCGHMGIATLTVGSIVRGVLEIYGTSNGLVSIYGCVGVLWLAAALPALALQGKRMKRGGAMLLLAGLMSLQGMGGLADTYIKLGSAGKEVSDLQTTLKALGYYYGDITGHAGEKTVAAIKAFQSRYGLTADGIAGPNTLEKIQTVYSGSGSSSSASWVSAATVKEVQTMLKALGFYAGDITGNIGTKTDAAIRAFQKKYGLTVDGIPGTKTMEKLTALYTGAGSSSGTSGSSGSTLRLGDTSATVLWMQELLKDLGYYTAECTGHFGSKTEAAVKRFQADHGLTADGIVGSKTMSALQEAEKGGGSGTPDFASSVLDLHWFDEKDYYLDHGIKAGNTITIMDVVTGKSFNGRIQSTGYHADVEPKTAEDTRIMCAMFGVTDASQIDYNRRAILVTATVSGTTYTYAASLYGEVHGAQTIPDNDYDGQFCVHFRHSTTSDTQMEYDVNQQPIDVAVKYATQTLGMTHITSSSQIR